MYLQLLTCSTIILKLLTFQKKLFFKLLADVEALPLSLLDGFVGEEVGAFEALLVAHCVLIRFDLKPKLLLLLKMDLKRVGHFADFVVH